MTDHWQRKCKSAIRSMRARSPTPAPTAEQLMRLLESQGYRCALSGASLTPDTATVDHAAPLCDGGTNAIANLQWLSVQVNAAKGSMSQGSFLRMAKEICDFSQNQK